MMKRIMIVVQENGEENNKGFSCYLAGDIERIDKIEMKDMSPAEYWGSHLFQLCIQVLQESGVLKSLDKKPFNMNKGVH